jgi:hypothetical protein
VGLQQFPLEEIFDVEAEGGRVYFRAEFSPGDRV